MPTILTAPKPVINDARPKVMGFSAGQTMPKTTIGARLYPSYACLETCQVWFSAVSRLHKWVAFFFVQHDFGVNDEVR
ncbi:MAG: hypothetical protein GY862_04025 [Gammaproteobacteria bacterium]|nr:hypothetical protein [Gammaproteobacteria bacterium]